MASSSNTELLMPIDGEEECKRILSLLSAKVNSQTLPTDVTVHDCDLYGDKNPWKIWEHFGGGKDGSMELCLFTIIRMDMATREVVRTIGSGSWEDQHIEAAIVNEDTNEKLAIKKCLTFGKSGTSHDGMWIMHEYRLVSSDLLTKPPSPFRTPSSNYSYVLCKLIKNQGRIRVRIMNQTRRVTINLPFPANAPASSSIDQNEGLRQAEIGSGQFQDKRITPGEETTSAQRRLNLNRLLQEIFGDDDEKEDHGERNNP